MTSAYRKPGEFCWIDIATKDVTKTKALFAKLSSQNRYAIIFRVTTAHRPELRAKRIERFVEMLAQGKTIYPQTPPLSKSR